MKIAQLYLHLIDKGLGGTICCPLKSAGGSSYQIHLFPRLFLVVYVQISKDHGRFGGRYTLSEIHLSNVPADLCRRSMWEYTLSTKTNPFCKMIVKKQKKKHLLLIQKHHDFEDEHIIDNNLFILVQNLKRFAGDDIILDRGRKCKVRA